MSGQEGVQEAWRDLQVIEEIERDAHVSQRTISQRVGIALGLTNNILRRLMRKGIIKTRTMPANRLAYYITAKGFSEKMRLVVEYVKLTTSFFSKTRELLNRRLAELKQEHGVKTVAIVGTGELAEATYLSIAENELELLGIYDDAKVGSRWLGLEVQSKSGINGADLVLYTEHELEEALELQERGRGLVLSIFDLFVKDQKAFARIIENESRKS